MKNLFMTTAAIILISVNLQANPSTSGENSDNKIVTLSPKTYEKETASGVVLVDYWASWCGPCRKLEPILKEIAKETDIKIGKINVDQHKDFVIKRNITSVPTMIVYKDGKEVERLIGFYSKNQLLKILGKHSE